MASLVMLFVLILGLVVSTGMLAVAVVGTTWLAMRNEERSTLDELKELGFDCEDRQATGTLSGYPVTAKRSADGTWVVTVAELPGDLALRTSTSGTKAHRTGDRRIDKRWAIGSLDGGVGRLGRQARHVLARLRPVVDSFVLSAGDLTVTVHSGVNLVDLVANLERLALEIDGDAVERLVDSVRTDPSPKVRGHMLWELAQVDRTRAVETIERRDPDSHWGAEELLLMGELLGRPRFLEAALEHPECTLRLAARVIGAWLLLEEDLGQALALVANRFGIEGLTAAAQRVRGPHAHHAPALIPWVTQVVQHQGAAKTRQKAAVALIRTLQDAGVRAALPELVYAMVELRGPAQVRAIAAVGSLGETHHVGELRIMQDRLPRTDFPAHRALEQAVAAIQGRSSGQAGALSLAKPVEGTGALALAPAPGDLAVVPESTDEVEGTPDTADADQGFSELEALPDEALEPLPDELSEDLAGQETEDLVPPPSAAKRAEATEG